MKKLTQKFIDAQFFNGTAKHIIWDGEVKKLSGKTLNAFCKRYFQHSNANHIFGSGSKYFEVFR